MSRVLVWLALLPQTVILSLSRRQSTGARRTTRYSLLERLRGYKLACKKLWLTSLNTVLSSYVDNEIAVKSNPRILPSLQMPRSRRRHRSRSHSRSHSPASPQYDHKRRRIDHESPQSKGTYSGERVLRLRQHERGTSQERRYKRSHRRSPSSGRQHSHAVQHAHRERDRERERDRDRERERPAASGVAGSTSAMSSSKRNRGRRHHASVSPNPEQRHRHRSPASKSQVV